MPTRLRTKRNRVFFQGNQKGGGDLFEWAGAPNKIPFSLGGYLLDKKARSAQQHQTVHTDNGRPRGLLRRLVALLGFQATALHRLTDTELFELDALLDEIEKRDAGLLPPHEVAELEQLLKRRDVVTLLGKMRALSLSRQDVVVRRILAHFKRLGFQVTTARQAAEMVAGTTMTDAEWQRVSDVWERNFRANV